jgi:hypothetical protein
MATRFQGPSGEPNLGVGVVAHRTRLGKVIEAIFLATKRRIYITMASLCVVSGTVALTTPSQSLLARLMLAISEAFLGKHSGLSA